MANQTIVDAIIDSHIAKDECFTAYGVACEAVTKGADESKHILKGGVHVQWVDKIRANGYSRTNQFDVGQPSQYPNPWIYYPSYNIQAAQDYANDLKTQIPDDNNDDDSVPSPNDTIPSPNDDNDDKKEDDEDDEDDGWLVSSTHRGHRIQVPHKLVKQIGGVPYDTVTVYPVNGIINIEVGDHKNPNAHILFVHRDGRIRLNPKQILAAGHDVNKAYMKNEFFAKVKHDKITVTLKS